MARKKTSYWHKPVSPLQLFFILVVTLTIPSTIFVLQQQQRTQSDADTGYYYCKAGAYGVHVTLSYDPNHRSECVKHLQSSLNSFKFVANMPDLLDIDGIFGPKTLDAVKRVQFFLISKGWYRGPVDGIVGPGTWAGMHRWGCESAKNDHARFIRCLEYLF